MTEQRVKESRQKQKQIDREEDKPKAYVNGWSQLL